MQYRHGLSVIALLLISGCAEEPKIIKKMASVLLEMFYQKIRSER